jgi:hypothetical protein
VNGKGRSAAPATITAAADAALSAQAIPPQRGGAAEASADIVAFRTA